MRHSRLYPLFPRKQGEEGKKCCALTKRRQGPREGGREGGRDDMCLCLRLLPREQEKCCARVGWEDDTPKASFLFPLFLSFLPSSSPFALISSSCPSSPRPRLLNDPRGGLRLLHYLRGSRISLAASPTLRIKVGKDLGLILVFISFFRFMSLCSFHSVFAHSIHCSFFCFRVLLDLLDWFDLFGLFLRACFVLLVLFRLLY